MKFIVVSTDKVQDFSTVSIFDSYIDARRSIQGFKTSDKLTMVGYPALFRKYPNMPAKVFRDQYITGKLKTQLLNIPVIMFKNYNNRYTITIFASNTI